MKWIILTLASLTLAACASGTSSLSADQCRVDWASVGYADGREGEPASKFDLYEGACERGGAPLTAAEEAVWTTGWRDGVEDLCRLDDSELTDEQIADRRGLCASVVASAPQSGDVADAGSAEPVYSDGFPRRSRARYDYPTIRPRIGVGVGSGGVRVGAGVGVGFGLFDLGVFF